ncbi:MAG: flavin monoamine oxidase family protein [Thermomicrobiales bacterium]
MPSSQWSEVGGRALTRRRFLHLMGAVGGAGAVMNTMTAWGFFATSAQTEPPRLEGQAQGVKVIVVGAGPGGCPAAYELMNLGYDVTVLEAQSHVGGHVITVKNGVRTHEYGGEEQVCNWDPGVWWDAGPSRIPFYHRGVLHYCKELSVPMIDHKNLDLNGYVFMEGIEGPLNGQRMRLHELQADMAGYISELLAKAADQERLDEPYTPDDHDLLVDYLVNWGIISPEDLTYQGSSRRGYAVVPDTRGPGEVAPPYPFQELLPFAAATLASNGGYLSAAATFDWQTTLMKPAGGVGSLFEGGFKRALGDRIKLNSPVTEIRQTEDGVRVVYTDGATGQPAEMTADYCVCNAPPSVLLKMQVDWSSEMREAVQNVPYAMAFRMGAQFKRRFWEEDDWIYGGQSFTNIPEIGILGYPDDNYFAQKGAMLLSYNFGNNAAKISSLSLQDRVNVVLEHGSKVHPQMRDEFESAFSVAWHRMPYHLGAWPSFTARVRQQYFPRLQEPDGRIYLVGEHLSYVNAWLEGAFQSAWVQVEKLHQRVMSGG